MRRFFALAVLLVVAPVLRAQALADTLFAWQGYGRESRCALAVYPVSQEARGRQDRYDRAVVLRERGDNAGPSTLADAPYLVEQAARTLGIDPVRIVWVFQWDGQSFGEAAAPGGARRCSCAPRSPARPAAASATRRGASSPVPTWKSSPTAASAQAVPWRPADQSLYDAD